MNVTVRLLNMEALDVRERVEPVSRADLRPSGWTDLRGAPPVTTLRYPADAVVVFAGIPGAGKSTMMHALFATTGQERRPVETGDGVRVLDSEQARNRWRDRLGSRLPYFLYRPLVHLTALAWARSQLRRAGTAVLHDCGTRRWSRALIRRWSAGRAGGIHLLLLDVPAEVALDGQENRRRRVRRRAFGRHLRAWREIVPADGIAKPLDGFASCTVLDRPAASGVRRMCFGDSP
ncbi:AAA family ATPase [Fodinicola acaciae]|uniref:AAA family ATPase n=1 Tax=Fodinicola acaciae TaxID=2681555 RepID=UPI0013D701DB|nr:AAA family ATPase [Fodinicola acaciae]